MLFNKKWFSFIHLLNSFNIFKDFFVLLSIFGFHFKPFFIRFFSSIFWFFSSWIRKCIIYQQNLPDWNEWWQWSNYWFTYNNNLFNIFIRLCGDSTWIFTCWIDWIGLFTSFFRILFGFISSITVIIIEIAFNIEFCILFGRCNFMGYCIRRYCWFNNITFWRTLWCLLPSLNPWFRFWFFDMRLFNFNCTCLMWIWASC